MLLASSDPYIWYSCPYAVPLLHQIDLYDQQTMAGVMLCHFQDYVIKNAAAFILVCVCVVPVSLSDHLLLRKPVLLSLDSSMEKPTWTGSKASH